MWNVSIFVFDYRIYSYYGMLFKKKLDWLS